MKTSKGDNSKQPIYNIDELKSIVDYYVNNYDDIQINIMFIKKGKKNKILKYDTYMFQCTKESIKGAVTGTLAKTSKILSKRKLDKYDLDVSIDDTVQTIDKNKVIHGEEVLSNLTIQYTDKNTLNDKIDFDGLDFLVMQISSHKKKQPTIVFFKKHLKASSKFKNSVRGTLNGKVFKPLEKSILNIGDNVDAFLIHENYYITNRNNFNSMLDFKDVYYKIIKDNEDEIIKANLLDDANQFIDDCKNDGRYLQRFTKAILAKGFENAKKYNYNLSDLISKHKLKLVLTEDKKIEYDKANINEILNLLLQHYVTSDLTNKTMIAKAIEQYN